MSNTALSRDVPHAPRRLRLPRHMGTLRGGSAGPYLVSGALLVAALLLALTTGAAAIPASSAARLVLHEVPLLGRHVDVGAEPEAWSRIVLDVRLPRATAAALVGAALACSGAGYQGVFRNPLASEYLLGVASGAGLGAAIALISPLAGGGYGFGWVPLFAFAGGGITVLAVYVISMSPGGGVSSTTLILAGVALSAVLSAATSFIMLTSGERAQPIFSFLFGTLNTSSWHRLAWGLPYMLVGGAVLFAYARVLNVLQLDEEQASHLGINVTRTKLIVLGAASLMATAAVAVAGVIGFVGLIVPHMVRLLFGTDHRRLLPLSALLGAAFLVGTDILGRTIIAPQEMPVGIITAVVGGPFFIYLLRVRPVNEL